MMQALSQTLSKPLDFTCACGAFHARLAALSPRVVNHVACYCDDCQAYAHHLGRVDDVLDSRGGTTVFQISPTRITIAAGAEHLKAVRFSAKGICRWYADCCKSPFANTMATRLVPFAGLVERHGQYDEETRARVLGPVKGAVFTQFAKNADADPIAEAPKAKMIAGVLLNSLKALATGTYRQTPFFDDTGAPVAEPTILSAEERDALRARAAA